MDLTRLMRAVDRVVDPEITTSRNQAIAGAGPNSNAVRDGFDSQTRAEEICMREAPTGAKALVTPTTGTIGARVSCVSAVNGARQKESAARVERFATELVTRALAQAKSYPATVTLDVPFYNRDMLASTTKQLEDFSGVSRAAFSDGQRVDTFNGREIYEPTPALREAVSAKLQKSGLRLSSQLGEEFEGFLPRSDANFVFMRRFTLTLRKLDESEGKPLDTVLRELNLR